ncbi:SDR family NAD(P)-dependent oxidoreductase [Mycolicibacterium goodii]|uniref:Short-chain dehydrogenase n=1 Tax=Mycolicibacterium goodii TaxID=134601 RepID=A0A0K0XHD7_MYCGD|nr:short-chain dehydrogenase [Mycolicibacterium goodii]
MSTDRSAVITGASRGIGGSIARSLAEQGFGLTITARNSDDLDATVPTLREAGARDVVAVAADMADPDALPGIVETHQAQFGDMSVLVLNAGVGTAGPIATYSLARLDKTFAVNFRAPYQLVQAALPSLRTAASRHPQYGSRVIVVASITGVFAEAGLAAYGASKAAALSLTDAINSEESSAGVLATAIAPGYVDTDMSGWIRDRIPASSMIPTEDIATIVGALTRLSPRSTIGRIIMTRAGTDGYRA